MNDIIDPIESHLCDVLQSLIESLGVLESRVPPAVLREALRSAGGSLIADAIAARAAASVAHELRNPLAVIATSTSLVRQRSSADASALRNLAKIERQVKLAASLSESLLHLGSPRALQRVALRPNSIFALATERVVLRSRVTVINDASDDELTFEGDELAVTTIIANLLINADRAAGVSGAIVLRSGRVGDHVCLFVDDDGPGIDPSISQRLFDLGATQAVGGNGLGLALSRALARSMNGDLALSSGSLQGACFALSLPSLRTEQSR
ncbi:MAG: ATP-binding protein [Deltaproteobacteria bacterium]|nr:ATP-binding protein [Deltaproteobacteria bacterium]